jgi:hypothetical protein
MKNVTQVRPPTTGAAAHYVLLLTLVTGLLAASGCAPRSVSTDATRFPDASAPTPDPRVGLGAGLFDAEEAIWNLRTLSQTPPPEAFVGVTNSDLAFTGNYAIQGNYNGIQIWDRVRQGHRAPDVVRHGLAGRVRAVVDRQDADVVAHADAAVLASVAMELGALADHLHSFACS